MMGATNGVDHGLLSALAPPRDRLSEGHAFAAYVAAVYEYDVHRTAESWVSRQRALHRWRGIFLGDKGGPS